MSVGEGQELEHDSAHDGTILPTQHQQVSNIRVLSLAEQPLHIKETKAQKLHY